MMFSKTMPKSFTEWDFIIFIIFCKHQSSEQGISLTNAFISEILATKGHYSKPEI